jgi:hypothetical protein
MGLDNGSGPVYLFWSGFFGDTTIIGGAVLLYWHHTCHAHGCWRLGRHAVDGTPYTACRKHHPLIDHTEHVTAETIGRAHAEAQS